MYKIDFIRFFWYNRGMKTKITYEEIGNLLGKSENTIKGWKQKFPALLNLVKIGAFCKQNDLDEEKIIKLIEIQELIKGKTAD